MSSSSESEDEVEIKVEIDIHADESSHASSSDSDSDSDGSSAQDESEATAEDSTDEASSARGASQESVDVPLAQTEFGYESSEIDINDAERNDTDEMASESDQHGRDTAAHEEQEMSADDSAEEESEASVREIKRERADTQKSRRTRARAARKGEMSGDDSADEAWEPPVDLSAEDSEEEKSEASVREIKRERAGTRKRRQARPRATTLRADMQRRRRNSLEEDALEEEEEEMDDEDSDEEADELHPERDQADEDEESDQSDHNDAAELKEADRTLRFLAHAHLSALETQALRTGHFLDGPPIGHALPVSDQWKRKFRWPMHLRNVRQKSFVEDAAEIVSDYDLQLKEPSDDRDNQDDPARAASVARAFRASLAPTARPIYAATAAVIAGHERSGLLDETSAGSNPDEANCIEAPRFRHCARIGARFTEQLLESLLTKNVEALQGVDLSYMQRCWTTLPVSRKPIATWRFILEHISKTDKHASRAPHDALCPQIQALTRKRIHDRLRTLYGAAWRDDEELWDAIDTGEDDASSALEGDIFRV